MTRRRSLLALLVLAALVFVGCGGGGDNRPTVARRRAPTPSSTTTSTTLDPALNQIAEVTGNQVAVFASPDTSQPIQTFPNPWQLDEDPSHLVPQVFLVEERAGSWLKVLLPVRPNGTTGWVRASDVRVTVSPYRILVELGAHRITVYDRQQVVLQGPVAVGAPATPTPTGTYYLRVLLRAPDPTTVYGPFAYGLSGHSDVLTSFNGGDGELGIHGNNDASVLGQSITHGCVRMSNDGITMLTGILPLGAPVQIVA